MHTNVLRLSPPRLIGPLVLTLALSSLVVSWSDEGFQYLTRESILLALWLAAALVLVQFFPIQIGHHRKMHIGSVPLYLLAVLLPPSLAATTTLIGMLSAELRLRAERGMYLSDVAGQVGRWTVLVLLGSLAGHQLERALPFGVASLLAPGIVLWVGDILTSPLSLSPITGESPRAVIVGVAHEAGPLEGAQYLVGMLGAAAAQRYAWTLPLLTVPIVLIYTTAKRAKELQESTRHILESMADAVDLRDPSTGGHSRRVAELTAGILQELGLRGSDVDGDLIIAAARVHDIGKIGVPDQVLSKSGPLTDEEWIIMKAHAELGAELLKRYPDFARGVDIVRHHHERWDGEGYPHRLQGTAIPFGARVIAVADSFDAMTSDRPYRRGMSVEQAAAILRAERGKMWEGAIVDAFLRSIADRLDQPQLPRLQLVPPPADDHEAVVPPNRILPQQ